MAQYRIQEKSLPGDVLLVTAFVSYVGCFTKNYRIDLVEKFWMPYLANLKKEAETVPPNKDSPFSNKDTKESKEPKEAKVYIYEYIVNLVFILLLFYD